MLALANMTGVGLTTLPKDRKLLAARIRDSVRSFEKNPDKPGGETYLFVMEDLSTKQIVGACGIVSKVGGFQPFYGYRIEMHLFESKQIDVRHEVPILVLHEDHDGPCEIGSLFLHPDWRRDGNGRLLQLVRFLFMAEYPGWFESTVVSEIRGVEENGESPFWNAIGRHFFGIDFAQADRLSVINKKFIADLMPDEPIYIPLLPENAQDVIGQPHAQSAPAVRNLAAEGFRFADIVDIFDAGPMWSCARDQIRTVRESRRYTIAAIVEHAIDSATYIVSNVAGDAKFRAAAGSVGTRDKGLTIDREMAHAIDVNVGDDVRAVLMKPSA